MNHRNDWRVKVAFLNRERNPVGDRGRSAAVEMLPRLASEVALFLCDRTAAGILRQRRQRNE